MKIRKPLGLLIITSSLFSGCDLVEQFIAEGKDRLGNKEALIFDAMTDGTLSNQKGIQLPKGKKNTLPQEKNTEIASNIGSQVDSHDDNLAPGWYKISGFAGGGRLKGAEGETTYVGLSGDINTFNAGKPLVGARGQRNNSTLGSVSGEKSIPAITEESYGSNDVVEFSYGTVEPIISGQNSSNLVTEEQYDSKNMYVFEDSYASAPVLTGQSGGLAGEEYDSNSFDVSYDSAYGVRGQSSVVNEDYDRVVIDSNDNRSKVKEYFNGLKDRLIAIKKGKSNEVIDKLIASVNKLAAATGGDNISIGEISASNSKASAISENASVSTIINEVKEIIEVAEKSGVEIKNKGVVGTPVNATDNTTALAALNGGSGINYDDGGVVSVEAGIKLAKEVAKADPWAMIDKIRNATTKTTYIDNRDNDAGELVTGKTTSNKGAGAKSNADLAAAVALKAMSRDGKFAAYKNGNDTVYVENIKKAAANAVNKVLGAIHAIVMQTLQKIK
ncbi:variable large family protein (plasmid) [Borrelia coriaceae]|uniref:Variable large protein n=1 Tax=Borrelia coriaceae ATCC 43381 TaxID=1408429 RepID=W5SXF9_9SPIR|nr:variable large family protein [Borrelia coriaceae]AHH11577.1 Variable major protein [Borrelia coriaceae ATCC 43381]UPA15883.1 variable large family protein [Borrelia coriaceae]UPA17243.1 variable large family protein [Borrelia coriaceae]